MRIGYMRTSSGRTKLALGRYRAYDGGERTRHRCRTEKAYLRTHGVLATTSDVQVMYYTVRMVVVADRAGES